MTTKDSWPPREGASARDPDLEALRGAASAAERDDTEAAEEGSGLGLYHRLRLYIRDPSEAFTVIPGRERRIDARWIFLLYFLIKAPVVVQRFAAEGRLARFTAAEWVGLVAGLLLSVVATGMGILVGGGLLHLLLNGLLRRGRSLGDALRLPVFAMAPYLLLALEYPTLILGYSEQSTAAVAVTSVPALLLAVATVLALIATGR